MSGTVFPQEKMIGPDGRLATPWRMFFQNLYQATGGANSVTLVPTTRKVAGHNLTADVNLTASDVGLSNVTNDAQTKAAIVPNTVPSAGQVLVGNAGGTAYAPVSLSGDASLTAAGALTVSKIGGQSVTLAGAVNLAGALTTVGAFASTFTMTGVTAVTFPTSGTLATLAGAETLTNKTLTQPVINNPTGTLTLASGSLGFATGNGGTVTQATNKSTGVTLNTMCGDITLNAAALAANTAVTFVLTNSQVAATDLVNVSHQSAGTAGAYSLTAQSAGGSASITVRNLTAGALSEAIVVRFQVMKGATS